jgi:hypothetical protein
MEHIFCPRCGFKNKIDNKFCLQCGGDIESFKETINSTKPPIVESKKKSNPFKVIAIVGSAMLLCFLIGFGAVEFVEYLSTRNIIAAFEPTADKSADSSASTDSSALKSAVTEAVTSTEPPAADSSALKSAVTDAVISTEPPAVTTMPPEDRLVETTLPEDAPMISEGGRVLNILSYTTEPEELFYRYFNEEYGYELPDGVTVNWDVVTSVDGAYEALLDEVLPENADTPAAKRYDMVFLETSFAGKYLESDSLLPVSALGFTEADLADQYEYTHTLGTDREGNLKGLSYYAAPNLFFYRRSAAEAVWGTDDPDEVQKHLSDWDKFEDAAALLDNNRYYITGSYTETLPLFIDAAQSPIISERGKLAIPESWADWAEHARLYRGEVYANYAQKWSDKWYGNMRENAPVFGFIGPSWFADFVLEPNTDAYGDWAVCEGPAPSHWGGSMAAALKGTDNADLVADIMRCLTADPDVAYDLVVFDKIFGNSQTAIANVAESPDGESELLGGQNPYAVFDKAAKKLKLTYIAPYTYDLSEEFAFCMYDYLEGDRSYASCLEDFFLYAKEEYNLVP